MIIPGILEKDFMEVVNKIQLVQDFTTIIQIDIADGKLVKGETFLEIDRIAEIKTKAEIEIHLMVENPLQYLVKKINNISRICAQIEVKDYIEDFINISHDFGYIVGLSLNPETEIQKLDRFLSKIDYVQFMTIIPGAQGNPFVYNVLAKINQFRQLYPKMPVQVDGGIDAETLPLVLETGVRDVIIGSHLFNQSDIRDAYIKFSNEELL
ncbi:hypothetical protein A3H26_01685 [candidate division WWE3 bacterium RIFCSPLOWO2_12_FULL_36_10]|uniref:Ribulose-phosphate 3-epimerase n=1 Tax=candidate division WWE3 bacterium RIFCSPLOWO2_12_FULL_36_10 TaxID=1802630 RepID=A0A1F4VHF6_UNCKA|nr:MAG: hypothetical protein A3H26_01685 [candidate division WWE3 bacterium RIFCSPLOWO2_12_FULL_36_10]